MLVFPSSGYSCAGSTVTLTIIRDKQEREIKIEVLTLRWRSGWRGQRVGGWRMTGTLTQQSRLNSSRCSENLTEDRWSGILKILPIIHSFAFLGKCRSWLVSGPSSVLDGVPTCDAECCR